MDKVKLESGQAMTEYILLLAIVIGIYSVVISKISQSNALDAFRKPFTSTFKYTYQYGNATARGQHDGGPTNIAQYHGENFRIFINPPINQ
jgi:hypothetical protein